MTVQDGKPAFRLHGEDSDKVTIALVSKYAPEGVGGIENHLDMLVRHVSAPNCSYSLIVGSDDAAERGRGLRGLVRFARELLRSRGELMHFHGFDRLHLLVLMIVARRRIPLIVTPHNGVAGIVNDQNSVRRFAKHRIDGVLFPILIRQRARIIALTAEERNYYLGRFPGCAELVEVLPNPIGSREWASLKSENSVVRLLSLSRLDPLKRIDDLISAMALLPPEVECDIAGPDHGAAPALRAQAGHTARTIRFHGAVRGAAKERLFEDASIVIVPSRAEGLSTVALEALAYGIPVIASDSAARGLPADGVYTYPFGSVADLAQTIEHLRAEENLVAARQAARRASAGLVGYDEYGHALRALYHSSVQQHRNRKLERFKDNQRGRLDAWFRGGRSM